MLNGMVRWVNAADSTLLRHEVVGSGEPVVFLHGGLVGRESFQRQAPLAERFRLILRDMRGHNGTEAIVPADYAYDTTEVEDLAAALDAERIEQTNLVGHSAGGAIAFAFARRYPERVRRIVLLEPSLLSMLPDEVRGMVVEELNEDVAVAERQGALAGMRYSHERLAGPGWDQRLPRTVVAQMETAAPMFVPHMRGMAALEVTEADVRSLAMPALLIYGGRSFDWERLIAARLEALRPDWPQLQIPEAGHNMHLQRPAEVNAAILQFLLQL